jgi:nitrogen fixation protein FixH
LELGQDRRVKVALRDGAGPLAGAEIDAVARHPLGRAPDIALSFGADPAGSYVSHQPLPAGRWLVHLHVRSGAAELRLIETLS